jgi:uncharacterized membrane protein YdbT with pleckstrin-like domain
MTSESRVTLEEHRAQTTAGAGIPQPVTIADRRLHPAYLVITLGRTVRGLIPVIAVGIWQAPGWTLAVLAGLVLLHSFALWWVRTYGVVDGALRVRGGLFKRTEDTIGLGRISSVDAERGLVQRLFRVWGVKIRTPGWRSCGRRCTNPWGRSPAALLLRAVRQRREAPAGPAASVCPAAPGR